MRIPASCAMRARTGAFRCSWSQPIRIFNVTGTGTARTTVCSIRWAAASSRIRAEPAICPTATFLTGHPKLISIRSAPRSTAIRAASAMASGSHPASCTAFGPPASATSAMRRVVSFSRTIAHEAIISETTRPAPSLRTNRRNGRSVTPDMGARITGVSRTTPPRSMGRSRGCVCTVISICLRIRQKYRSTRPCAMFFVVWS